MVRSCEQQSVVCTKWCEVDVVKGGRGQGSRGVWLASMLSCSFSRSKRNRPARREHRGRHTHKYGHTTAPADVYILIYTVFQDEGGWTAGDEVCMIWGQGEGFGVHGHRSCTGSVLMCVGGRREIHSRQHPPASLYMSIHTCSRNRSEKGVGQGCVCVCGGG
jgi:hypothetical protein